LGCLVIFQYNKALNFTKNDQHLLDIFAQHASISIDNATLFEQMQRMARYDEVTGLLNRRALYETGEYELARANRLDRPIAVAMVDLDNYKEINDNYNHLIGDKVLKEISRLFRENVRNIDIVGRYGGDECVIIMPETDIENACAAIERIRCVLESQAIKVDENQFHITACFGISAYKEKPPSLERIIDEADTAMYAAKEAGRNAIRVFQKL
jgi:diguanylate cyclase (GGDEF)-like protein